MSENHRSGAVSDDVSKDITWVNKRFTEQANCDSAFLDHFIRAVESNANKMLLRFADNIGNPPWLLER